MRATSHLIVYATALMIMMTVPVSAGSLDIYEHNGSVIDWYVQGDTIKATYATPRPGTETAGVRSGAVLFEGAYEGGRIVGRAYAFKPGCPPAGYDVIGEETRGAIALRGPAPHRASNSCAVVSYLANSPHARLVLTFSATHH